MGAVVRSFRKRKGWTQLNLAHRLGWSDTTWSRYEQGAHTLPPHLIQTLEGLLGLEPCALEATSRRLAQRHEGFTGTSAWRFRTTEKILSQEFTPGGSFRTR